MRVRPGEGFPRCGFNGRAALLSADGRPSGTSLPGLPGPSEAKFTLKETSITVVPARLVQGACVELRWPPEAKKNPGGGVMSKVMERKITGRANSTLIIVAVALLSCFLVASCQKAKEGWTPPKFVKEWEVKEIKPGLAQRILSVTANKKGVFALVEAKETKYHPPENLGRKKASEMTKKEKKWFLDTYVSGLFSSGIAVLNMTEEDKDEVIGFVAMHMIPLAQKKAVEMSEKEKDIIVDFLIKFDKKFEAEVNKGGTIREVKRKGKDSYIDGLGEGFREAVKEDVYHYRIQHYDFDGNFVVQWPDENKLSLSAELVNDTRPIMVHIYNKIVKGYHKTNSRDYFIRPLDMVSDDSGNVYVADYEGNKIAKFNPKGDVQNLWMVEHEEPDQGYGFLDDQKGVAMGKGTLYIISMPYFKSDSYRVSIFDLDGKIIEEKEFGVPKVPAFFPHGLEGKEIPLIKLDGNIHDIAVDGEGNIYLLSGYPLHGLKVVMYDKDFNKKIDFVIELESAVDFDAIIYDPDSKKKVRYRDIVMPDVDNFDALMVLGYTAAHEVYVMDNIYLSPQDELFVAVKGEKLFGNVNAVVYDRDGKLVGYWKVEEKSYSEWFKGLSDIERIKAKDIDLSMAFHDKNVFVAKTIEYRKGDKLRTIHGELQTHSMIQKFER